jgi:hypothetical protein
MRWFADPVEPAAGGKLRTRQALHQRIRAYRRTCALVVATKTAASVRWYADGVAAIVRTATRVAGTATVAPARWASHEHGRWRSPDVASSHCQASTIALSIAGVERDNHCQQTA